MNVDLTADFSALALCSLKSHRNHEATSYQRVSAPLEDNALAKFEVVVRVSVEKTGTGGGQSAYKQDPSWISGLNSGLSLNSVGWNNDRHARMVRIATISSLHLVSAVLSYRGIRG